MVASFGPLHLLPLRVLAFVLAFAYAMAAPAFAGQRPRIQDFTVDTEFARTEVYRYPTLELFLSVKKEAGEIFLDLQCSRVPTATTLNYQDFRLHVFDDRHEEVPCKPDPRVDFFTKDGWALGELTMSLKPGHIPVTASIWYGGYEHVFTFKLKATEPIK